MSRSGWSASSNTDPALENLPNISRKQQSQSTLEVNAVKAPRQTRLEPQKFTAAAVKREVSALRDPMRARFLQGFFRTRQGEYAEGDRMLGLPVPAQRKIARAFRDLPLGELQTLLASPFHEHRLIALIILVAQHKRASADRKAELHQFYLGHLSGVNNWDLVNSSAPALVGEHLTGSVASKEKQLRTLSKYPPAEPAELPTGLGV